MHILQQLTKQNKRKASEYLVDSGEVCRARRHIKFPELAWGGKVTAGSESALHGDQEPRPIGQPPRGHFFPRQPSLEQLSSLKAWPRPAALQANAVHLSIPISASVSEASQRNRTSSFLWLVEKDIYYKKFAYAIMVAKKSRDLPSLSWRLRKAGGIIQCESKA